MIYTMSWKTLPGKAEFRKETFAELSDALDEANMAQIKGPHPVEVTVTDDQGVQHYIAVHG